MVIEIHNEGFVSDTGYNHLQINEVLKIVQDTLDNYPKIWEKISDMEIGLVFVNRQEITELNHEYRDKSEITDVLSFALSDNLGEIYMCPDFIEERLALMMGEESVSSKDNSIELLRMFIHGMLHLAGYDHKGHLDWSVTVDSTYSGDEEMFKLQEEVLKNVLDIYNKNN